MSQQIDNILDIEPEVINEIFFEKSPVPKWIFDIETLCFLAVNESAIFQYGYSRDEFLSLTLDQIRPSQDVDHFLESFDSNRNSNYSNPGIYRHKKKDGTVFFVQVYSYPLTFNNRNARLAVLIDIDEKLSTEQKNIELSTQLIKQKKQTDDILSGLDEFIWSRKVNQVGLEFVNKACFDVTGYTEQEMLTGAHDLFFSIIHPEDKAFVESSKNSLFTSPSSKVSHRFRIIHKTKGIRHLQSNILLHRNYKNEPTLIIGVTKDITDEILSEKLLKDKAAELELILDTINDGYFTLDRDWKYTYVNREYLKIINKKQEEVLGRSIWDVFPYLRQMEIYSQYHKAVNENAFVSFEEYSPHLNIYLLIRAYPTPGGLTVCLTNITEEKQLQDKLKKNEQNLKSLIDNTDDFIFSVDKEMNIISINQPFKDLKYRITGIMPKPGTKVVPFGFGAGEVKEIWEHRIARALAGEAYPEVSKLSNQGKDFYIESRFNPIRDENKNIVGVSCFAKDITQHQNLYNKIAQDEINLRALINNTEDIMWSVDRNLKIISTNNAHKRLIKKLTGVEIDTGVSILIESLGSAVLEKWLGYFKNVFNGQSVQVVDRSIDESVERFAETIISPIYNNDKEIIGASVFGRDITDRLEQLRLIAEKEINLSALINNTQDKIWSVDRNLRIISANNSFKEFVFKICGVKPEIGSRVMDLGLDDAVITKWIDYANRAFTGESINITEESIDKSNLSYVESHINPIRNDENEIVGATVFVRDITERIKQQNKIIEQEINLKALIDNTSDMIWSVDRNLNIISANYSFKKFIQRVTGRIPEIGKSIAFKELGNETLTKWKEHAKKVLQGEKVTFIDKSIELGSERYSESSLNPIYDNNGHIVGASCFIRDITDQKKYLDRIKAQNDTLKDIAWIQSHRVRAKVATILGLSQLFNNEDISDPINTFILNGLKECAEGLDIIIREINDKTQTIG